MAIKNGLIFAETSAKTGDGIEDIFLKSAKEIAKHIDEGNYYDLTSEICGIKKGNARKTKVAKENKNNTTIELENEENKDENKENKGKKCC